MTVGRRVLQFAATMTTALSTGAMFGTWSALGPSVRTFSPSTYVDVQQATVGNLAPVMRVLMPAAVASQAALAVALRDGGRSPASALTAASSACQLASLVLTGAIELPINRQVLTWTPGAPPSGWEQTRDRWQTVHGIRTATSLVGLACAVVAALTTPAAVVPRRSRADHARDERRPSA